MKDLSRNYTICFACKEKFKNQKFTLFSGDESQQKAIIYTRKWNKELNCYYDIKYIGSFLLHATKCDIEKCRKET